jgi:hypothetical protein
MKLRLARFEHEALERYASSERVTAVRVIRTAVAYYLRERGSDRAAWPVPRLAREEPEGGPALEVEVEVNEATWGALEEEAAAQGVEPEELARHALLFFLADVDSGRVAAKLERVVRPE